MTDTPNPIDLHVGGRIRTHRKIIGVSQERLADDLGLTFQQVQNYERGANRVSASKLYEIAKSLRVSIAYFFEGLADPSEGRTGEESGADAGLHEFLMTTEPDFAVLTAARVTVRTFADRRAALDFAEANVAAFGTLTVVRIERIVRTTRLRTVRYQPKADDLAIPAMPGAPA